MPYGQFHGKWEWGAGLIELIQLLRADHSREMPRVTVSQRPSFVELKDRCGEDGHSMQRLLHLKGTTAMRVTLCWVLTAFVFAIDVAAAEFGTNGGPEAANIDEVANVLRQDPYDMELLISYGTSRAYRVCALMVIAATPAITQTRPSKVAGASFSPRNTTPIATPIGTRR